MFKQYDSDTSSYGDECEEKDASMELNFEEKKEMAEKELGEMEAEEWEEGTTSSYAKFKTAHEVDPELIEKYAPKIPSLDDMDDIIEFGRVTQCLKQQSGILLVEPNSIT
mmetsp:Transcript_15408/g.11214  ORF Transcript_15408/g.11214 Transcript_15408/m.11214 type:complete len:110 (+) Transcript_15408:49-378(+)